MKEKKKLKTAHKDEKQDKALIGKMMKKEMPKIKVKMIKEGCK